jgi:hypothetical protein
MTQYLVKSNNSLVFEVTKEHKLVGKLSYKSWFRFDAAVEIANNSTYKIEPRGFWGTTIELRDGEKVLLNFKMNWNGAIVVQTYFNNQEKDYIFKHRGIFKESFVLTDQDGIELLVMKSLLKWTKMNYEFQVTTSESFESSLHKEILLMISVHCANYYLSMMMAAGVPGA